MSKPKFKENDIVLTKNNTLAIIKIVSSYCISFRGKDKEKYHYSVDFISTKHSKKNGKYVDDFNAWHDEDCLRLTARTNTLKQLIALTKNFYEKFLYEK